MIRKSPIYLGIALAFGMTSALLPAQAVAQDAAADEPMEEIVTTGTRIKSDQFSGINPVVVIDSNAISESGQLNVSDVLRQQVQNTLGSSYEGFNSNSTVDASLSLRGIGSGRTLVLIDGRRLPGSPKQAGAAANINMIPTEAIERVEILTDGASSIYGGDASGGVVNIITKKDFEGISFRIGAADPTQDGGGYEDSYGIVLGVAGENSNVVFSYEHQERENIFWKDRWFTKSAVPADSNDLSEALNVSQGSRTWIDLSTFQYLPMAACVGNDAMVDGGRLFYDGTFPGDSGCLYDYTQIGSDDASRESDAISTQMTYEINENMQALVRATFSRVKGNSRFAPAVGTYAAPAGSLDVLFPTYELADGTLVGPEADLSYDYDLFTSAVVGIDSYITAPSPRAGLGLIRFNDAGNRDMETVGDMFDLMFALDGQMDNGWYWDATLQVNNQQTAEWDYNYINKTAYQGVLADGLDPLDPENVALYRADLFEKATNDFSSWQFGLGKPINDSLDIYFGAEGFEFEYASRYDAVREGLNAIGSAGNSSSGSRDAYAIFGELLYSIGKANISASARFDDYSDFGDTTNFKLGASYDINDQLLVRASYGTSFIPPDMQSLYAADIESYPFTTDYVACDAAGIAEEDCKERQYGTYYTSNPTLDAETSDNVSAGLVWSPLDNLQFRVEYYNITIDDAITFLSLQALVDAEREGGSALADLEAATGGELNRTPDGKLSTAIDFPSYLPTNNSLASFTTSGFDLAARYVQEIGPGDFILDAAYTQILEYEQEEYYAGPINDAKGRFGIPEFRYNVTLGYQMGDHSLNVLTKYVDSTAEKTDASYNKVGKVEDQTRYDVNYSYNHPWDGKLQLGCRNCGDKDPPLTSVLDFDRGLFDNRGRMYYVNIQQSF